MTKIYCLTSTFENEIELISFFLKSDQHYVGQGKATTFSWIPKISLRIHAYQIFRNFIYTYLPGVMKTRVGKHFVIPLNFPCLIACLLSSLLMSFFLFVLYLGLCVDVAVDIISRISFFPRPLHHHHHHHHYHHLYLHTVKTSGKNAISLPLFFFFVILPTILS